MADLCERFEAKFIPEPNSGCWLWTASCQPTGYGQIKTKNGVETAHRVSWQLHHGQIPTDSCVLHRCDVKSCVNPEHLYAGTHSDNMRDFWRHGRMATRKTHHKLTTEEVLAIRNSDLSHRELARLYGVKHQSIYAIKTHKTWRHV